MRTLVLYYNVSFPMRRSVRDHLLSFRRYLPGRTSYLNLAHPQQVRALRSARLASTTDVVVLETTLLSLRWDLERFRVRFDAIAQLGGWDAVKLAFPQDEFFRTEQLEEQLERLNVSDVFSVAPSSEWSKIYPRLSRSSTRFYQVLTGYLDEALVREVGDRHDGDAERAIAIGYRAWRAEPWLGRLGQLKATIGDAFAPYDRPDFRVDVSTRHEDTLLGSAWTRFLQRCQAMPGCGSGASILDADGTLRTTTQDYLATHPRASFEEVEDACFPGRDGELGLNVIGPRHLEACLTRTCQLLVPDDYSGVLSSDEHYVPIPRDLEDLDAAVDVVRDRGARTEVVERAYAEVVESGRWTYRSFIEREVLPVLEEVADGPFRLGDRAHVAFNNTQRRVRDVGTGILTGTPRMTARVFRTLRVPISEDQIIGLGRTVLRPLRRMKKRRRGAAT